MKFFLSQFSIFLILQINVIGVFSQSDLELVKNEIVENAYLKNATIGIQVVDLATGEILVEHQKQTSVAPASTTKLFATASAYEIIGADYQPKTRIYYQGEISSAGVLKGDVWIRGGGDVALGSRYFTDNES